MQIDDEDEELLAAEAACSLDLLRALSVGLMPVIDEWPGRTSRPTSMIQVLPTPEPGAGPESQKPGNRCYQLAGALPDQQFIAAGFAIGTDCCLRITHIVAARADGFKTPVGLNPAVSKRSLFPSCPCVSLPANVCCPSTF